MLHGKAHRITVDIIKENSESMTDSENYEYVDNMHIFHTILSRELPSERIAGIINLILAKRAEATTKEIEDSLVCNLELSFL